ncbi:hypothetical protein AQUCO_02300212v1 [Aquilegia coerulea]|uniref:DYW domain-containing protein n=1 Tax=Aquilegia coerulea TaxID=218851 RepID=A0A2G5DDJ1_AQUCA|nr:hypothetical protein AQUCO_02300212v1 [Aquilegia coerulea]
MYAKCGGLQDCQKLFDRMKQKNDIVTWNILLSGYASSKTFVDSTNVMRLFNAMHECKENPKINAISVAIVLPVCARLQELGSGRSVHGFVIKSGLESETLVGNALVSMYAKCGCVLGDAYYAFLGTVRKDVVSWNAIIAGYAENGLFEISFKMFQQMVMSPIEPNYATVANILSVCASVDHDKAYYFGKEIHCYVLRRLELGSNVSVCNSLLSLYSRIGSLKEAEHLFRMMKVRDIVSWNAIIGGYALCGGSHKSLELFHELLSTGIQGPDSVTCISVLPVCAQLRKFEEGQKIHEYIRTHPLLCEDTAVGNALISFYAKCDEVLSAFQTFSKIPRKDLISWNAMLDAYSESENSAQFFNLLCQMFKEGIRPDSITILSILHFVCSVSIVKKVKEVHAYSIRASLFKSYREPTVGNAILDAYAKCGDMEYAFKTFESLSGMTNVVTGNTMISGYVSRGSLDDAEIIFSKMSQKDLTTWNLMVRAYAENECPKHAVHLFHELQLLGMKPDMVSVMSVLPVCARLASVHLVRQCHGYIIRSSFQDVRLQGALLDLYSKCGSIDSAQKLFQMSLQKDLVMFTAMVGGYAMHGMGKEALRVFDNMIDLEIKPDHVILTTVLSACSHAGLVNEGLSIYESIDRVHGMKPTMEHYACTVDLLARGGRLKDAYSLITAMPYEANANVWGTLLGACRNQREVELGRTVADHLFKVEANNIGNYVVMSNIYAADARWDGVKELRKLMKDKDLKKPAGCSWIEVECERHVFVAGDFLHPARTIIYDTLCILDQQIKEPP